jgi:multidrug efflux pump subunit AcrB
MIVGVAVPMSIVGAFAVMYLFGYSVDNLSLMASQSPSALLSTSPL